MVMLAKSRKKRTEVEEVEAKKTRIEVVMERIIVDEGDAADLLGKSKTTLRNWRLASADRVRAGLPPLGPRWIVLNGSVAYEPSALRDWVRETSAPCDPVLFRGANRVTR
jgi:hypothetical protein